MRNSQSATQEAKVKLCFKEVKMQTSSKIVETIHKLGEFQKFVPLSICAKIFFVQLSLWKCHIHELLHSIHLKNFDFKQLWI